MGGQGSNQVVDRIADVLEGIGAAESGAAPTGDDTTADRPDAAEFDDHTDTVEPTDHPNAAEPGDRSHTAEPVTDGGADEAPPGDSPWTADDPIVFGDDADAEQGAAILDAVTDEESAPPFAESESDDSTDPDRDGDDDSAVDEAQLGELEARIGALESDHVQLESQMADVASAIAELQGDVDRVGEDVLELVTAFAGVALASEQSGTLDIDASRVASKLATELEDVVQTAAAQAAEDAIDGSSVSDVADGPADVDASTGADGSADEPSADAGSDERSSADDGASGADAFSPNGVPEGIHRGIGDPPEPSTSGQSTPEPLASGPSASKSAPADAAVQATSSGEVDTTESAESNRAREQPSRELVDPRSDAVGARLRQFREGFVDDPTAGLPTGNTADDFRFEKVLLPTDGEAAPDLSAEELEKPYLESLPDGYAADAVVLEWLDWLVSAADGETAAHAIGYYESIGWLTDDARDELLGYLEGLGAPGTVDGTASVAEPPAALDLQDHLRSLQYVTELATGEVGADGI